MNRKTLGMVFALGVGALLAACSSSSHKQQIIVAMTTPPPFALEIKLSAPLAATVTNDSGGVNWTLACDNPDCGTLSAASSASGDTIILTAPQSIPEADYEAGGMEVEVTATSATDGTTFATASMFMVAVADVTTISGPYAFLVSGIDVDGNPYSAAGSVTLDGAGDVVGGEEDYNNGNTVLSTAATLTGTYTVGEDGQGEINLVASDPNIGVDGAQTLAITILNFNHVLVTEFDGEATSSGTLDFQTFTADDTTQISGGYAFAFNGDEEGFLWNIGGVMTTDGSGNITAMTWDQDFSGSPLTNQSAIGSYTAPDANGRGTAVLFPAELNYAYYIVGPEAIRFVEIDAFSETSGSAFGQGGSAGNFDASALDGPTVFNQNGFTPDGPYGAAGLLTADGAGNFSAGFGDFNEGNGTPTNGAITGTYNANVNSDGSGYGNAALTVANTPDITTLGVYLVDPTLNLDDPNSSGDGGAVIMGLDVNAFGVGVVEPQDTSAVFAGNYAIDFQAIFEADLVGQVFSDGVSNITGSGSLNNLFASAQGSQNITATFTPDGANPGRATVSLVFSGISGSFNLAAYQTTSGQVEFVDVDGGIVAVGVVQGQF